MTAYILGFVTVNDPEAIKEYIDRLPDIHEKYGASILSMSRGKVMLEGEDDSQVVALLEFPDKQSAEAYWYSDEYQEARKIRVGHSEVKAMLIESGDKPGGK
jgi:uncharacterized protein (DUF1330 family)